jgi:hypothetical protein
MHLVCQYCKCTSVNVIPVHAHTSCIRRSCFVFGPEASCEHQDSFSQDSGSLQSTRDGGLCITHTWHSHQIGRPSSSRYCSTNSKINGNTETKHYTAATRLSTHSSTAHDYVIKLLDLTPKLGLSWPSTAPSYHDHSPLS